MEVDISQYALVYDETFKNFISKKYFLITLPYYFPLLKRQCSVSIRNSLDKMFSGFAFEELVLPM